MFHYWKYKFFSIIVKFLPPFIVYCIVDLLSDLYYFLSLKRKKSVRKNVLAALSYQNKGNYPENIKKANKLTRQIFRSFGYYLVEFFSYDKYDREWMKENVTVHGTEYIDAALRKGKGIVLISAHIGNWELAGVVTAMLGYPVEAVYQPHKNAKLDRLYINQRISKGMGSIPLEKAGKACMECLKKKRVLGLVSDVTLAEKGQRVKMFDHKVELPRGPEILATRTGAEICFCFLFRKGREKFNMEYYPFTEGMNEEWRNSGNSVTQIMADRLQDFILEHLDQWCLLWDIFGKHG